MAFKMKGNPFPKKSGAFKQDIFGDSDEYKAKKREEAEYQAWKEGMYFPTEKRKAIIDAWLERNPGKSHSDWVDDLVNENEVLQGFAPKYKSYKQPGQMSLDAEEKLEILSQELQDAKQTFIDTIEMMNRKRPKGSDFE